MKIRYDLSRLGNVLGQNIARLSFKIELTSIVSVFIYKIKNQNVVSHLPTRLPPSPLKKFLGLVTEGTRY
jgi:hypothetical protein